MLKHVRVRSQYLSIRSIWLGQWSVGFSSSLMIREI